MLFNVVGAIAWVGLLASIGYYLGSYVWVQQNVGSIVIGLIIITAIPVITTYLKERKRN
jgi:membrane-associated protein